MIERLFWFDLNGISEKLYLKGSRHPRRGSSGLNTGNSMKESTVYIMANERNGTIYVGVSSNLIQRVWQHKNHLADGFTKKYKITTRVYFEQALTIESAIAREKELKGWSREKKIFLIEETNPYWMDLYDSII